MTVATDHDDNPARGALEQRGWNKLTPEQESMLWYLERATCPASTVELGESVRGGYAGIGTSRARTVARQLERKGLVEQTCDQPLCFQLTDAGRECRRLLFLRSGRIVGSRS